MINNYKELQNEINMLVDNINRICVTKDKQELERMRMHAQRRLNEIYEYNKKRLMMEEE